MTDNYTRGPLRVVQLDKDPSIVQIVKTVEAGNLVVFEERRPCSSSEDKSVDDAMSCRNMWRISEAERELYAQMNRRHLNDMILRAAAPAMLEALRAILLQVNQGTVFERDACIAQARAALPKLFQVEHLGEEVQS